MRGDGASTERRTERTGGTERGAVGVVEVKELRMSAIFSSKKHSEVISSDGGLSWWGRYAEERRENGEQLMRVRH